MKNKKAQTNYAIMIISITIIIIAVIGAIMCGGIACLIN